MFFKASKLQNGSIIMYQIIQTAAL